VAQVAAVDTHRRHVRTSNAIESSFAAVKLCARVTKGAGSKEAALAWPTTARRRPGAPAQVQGHHLVAELLDGARFKDGIRVTEDDNDNDNDEMTDERVAV
jgi:hypothetical protein